MIQRTAPSIEEARRLRAAKGVRRITMFLFGLQFLCWFAFVFVLYYYVPAYKKLHQDFPDVTPTRNLQHLVAVSTWIVIHTRSDAVFPVCLIAFLGLLTVWNVCIGSPSYSTKPWFIWSIVGSVIPFFLLGFEVCTIADAANRLTKTHPELLEYGFWWVNIFS